MRELIVVRHGEADHMVTSPTGGWTDSHLTELGKRQALATASALVGLIGQRRIRFCSSDLARAAETSEIISRAIGVTPEYVAALRELNNGAAADLTTEEAARIAVPMTYPVVDWAPYPGAESWRAMTERVESFLGALPKQEDDLTVLVLHGNSGNAAVCWWLRLQLGKHNLAFELAPCSISRFSTNEYGERVVVKLNDTSHLAGVL